MSSSDEALAKLQSWRSFQIPFRWTIFPSPSSADLTHSREMRADIEFVDAGRKYVRIWASDKFMRSFSMDGCEFSVSAKSLSITRPSGERHLLVEEGPIA